VRIGIFGGTFNPIHLGHLRCAEEVRETQKLDRVLFVPTSSPPHKQPSQLAPAQHRLVMVRRAIAGNPAFRASAIEIERPGHSYSVDTLEALRRAQPRVRFAFILGIDAFKEISTWRDYRRIFSLCDLIVTSRPDHRAATLTACLPVAARREFCYLRKRNVLEHQSGHRIIFQPITDFAISASDVRRRVARGHSIRYLVPPSTERYITQRCLYHSRGTSR
jgi:nicotinate-nucleotide adenylyltransferase